MYLEKIIEDRIKIYKVKYHSELFARINELTIIKDIISQMKCENCKNTKHECNLREIFEEKLIYNINNYALTLESFGCNYFELKDN